MNPHEADTVEIPVAESPHGRPSAEVVSPRAPVDLGALSDRGKVRPNNEDHYLVVRFGRSLQTLLTNLPAGRVPDRADEVGYGMLVADGVGGHAAGEVASRVAIEALVSLVLHTPDWILRFGDAEVDEVLRRMTERYRQIDATLREQAAADPQLAGMGTTMTLAANLGTDLLLAHVGDSRAYLLRGGDLNQLTRDHTLVHALVALGDLCPADVARHRLRHVLTSALGYGGPLDVEVQRVRLQDGDAVLLCTDGLTDLVDDAAIASVLRDAASADDACRELVGQALAYGGKDNVTVVVARYHFPPVSEGEVGQRGK